MAKKVDPMLKTAPTPEATELQGVGAGSGDDLTSKSGSESSSELEQPTSPDPGSGGASGEKHTSLASSREDSDLHLAVTLAWDEAMVKLRETGMLSRLPAFATADWFYLLIRDKLDGVLK